MLDCLQDNCNQIFVFEDNFMKFRQMIYIIVLRRQALVVQLYMSNRLMCNVHLLMQPQYLCMVTLPLAKMQ